MSSLSLCDWKVLYWSMGTFLHIWEQQISGFSLVWKKNPFDFFFFLLLTLGNGLTIPRNCCSIGKNKSHKLSGNEQSGTKRKRKNSLRLKRPSPKNNIFVQSRKNSENKLLKDIYRWKDCVTFNNLEKPTTPVEILGTTTTITSLERLAKAKCLKKNSPIFKRYTLFWA